MVTSNRQAARRREQQRTNRLGRVREAIDLGDDLKRMYEAWNFWRASLKRIPPDERAAHRQRIADLLVNDALLELDRPRHAHLEVAA